MHRIISSSLFAALLISACGMPAPMEPIKPEPISAPSSSNATETPKPTAASTDKGLIPPLPLFAG